MENINEALREEFVEYFREQHNEKGVDVYVRLLRNEFVMATKDDEVLCVLNHETLINYLFLKILNLEKKIGKLEFKLLLQM